MNVKDPVPDIPTLVAELRERDLFARPAAMVSYLVRFTEPRSTEAAELQAASDGWSTSVLADPDGCVLRMSREGAVTLDGLRQDKRYIRALALEREGRWEAFSAEPLEPPSVWEKIADRLGPACPVDGESGKLIRIPRQRSPHADNPTDIRELDEMVSAPGADAAS